MKSSILRSLAFLLVLPFALQSLSTHAREPQNLILVTLDGVRWQEVFAGIDLSLVEDDKYTQYPDALKKKFWHEQRTTRRERLFPFLWSVISKQGALVGDRENESFMRVTNHWWFSYPGYNEILTGRADPAIDSNDKNYNQNVTFLEVLNNTPGFKKQVSAFASWDAFPFIINAPRSNVPVNVAPPPSSSNTSPTEAWLNEASQRAPRLWPTARLDFLTHGYAMDAIANQHPRVVFISYDETDDFAHEEHYDRYINAAHRTDQMLADLWTTLQNDLFYKDRTTLIITTDHGRGSGPGWPHHLSPEAVARLEIENLPDGIVGSDQIWLAAIGPGIPSVGLIKGQWTQAQIAATVLAALQLDPQELMPDADEPMHELLTR
jgi:hypothetical protein